MLTYPELLGEYRKKLKPEMFFDHSNLYRLMVEVDEIEGLTFKGLAKRVTSTDRLKRLHEIKAQFISTNRMDLLINSVKKQLLRKDMQRVATNILEEDADPDETLRKARIELDDLHTTESDALLNMESHIDEWLEYTEEVAKDPSIAMGMLTGMSALDALTKGFRRQDFIVIGGRTSMGKSAFEIELSLLLAENGYKGAIFSLEMSRRQIYNRMAANRGQYALEKIMTGDINDLAMQNIKKNAGLFKQIYIDDTRGISADYIVDTMRNLKRTQGLDFVVVDYLQDVRETGEQNDNSGSALSRVCRKLRAGAQQCDCAVFGLSQIARGAEKNADKRPTNADLSGSTGIETSADMIALLYREDYYDPDTEKKNIMEVNFTKNRNGPLGKVELIYDKTFQKIYSRW